MIVSYIGMKPQSFKRGIRSIESSLSVYHWKNFIDFEVVKDTHKENPRHSTKSVNVGSTLFTTITEGPWFIG